MSRRSVFVRPLRAAAIVCAFGATCAALAAPAAAENPGRVRPPGLPFTAFVPDAQRTPTSDGEVAALVRAAATQLLRGTAAAPAPAAKPVALLVPHEDWRLAGTATAAALRLLKPGDFARVVLVGPARPGALDGFATDDAARWTTPLGEIALCREPVRALGLPPAASVFNAERALDTTLPLLQTTLGSFCLVPVLTGHATAAQETQLVERLAALADDKTLFVFASDMSAFGPRLGDPAPAGPEGAAVRKRVREQDDRTFALLAAHDAAGLRAHLAALHGGPSGGTGLNLLAALLPRIAPKSVATVLARYDSLDVPRVKDDNAVAFAAVAFAKEAGKGEPLVTPVAVRPDGATAPVLSSEDGKRLVTLARATLETALTGRDALPRGLDALPSGGVFDTPAAVFVTLWRSGADAQAIGGFRGSLGQTGPVYPLYRAVVHAALDAALHDRRFLPMYPLELERVSIEVSVLSPPRPVAAWLDINPLKQGVVLRKGDRAGMFLPDEARRGLWSREKALSVAAERAGLDSDAWRDGATLFVFETQSFNE